MCNHLVLILLPCATFVITKINNLFLVQNTKCILNYAKLVKKGRVIHEDARHNKDSQCKQQVKSQKKCHAVLQIMLHTARYHNIVYLYCNKQMPCLNMQPIFSFHTARSLRHVCTVCIRWSCNKRNILILSLSF
jgi:hypothetical protein